MILCNESSLEEFEDMLARVGFTFHALAVLSKMVDNGYHLKGYTEGGRVIMTRPCIQLLPGGLTQFGIEEISLNYRGNYKLTIDLKIPIGNAEGGRLH